MDSILLSIIVPTYNTSVLTRQCLQDLRDHPPRTPHEIIVIDNHSSDNTLETLSREFPDVTLICNSANLGFSKACNRAAKEAKGRYLCFLNSDTVNGAQAIDMLAVWLTQHPKTGIAGPQLQSPEGQLIQMSWVWDPILEGELFQQYLAPYSLRRSAIKRTFVGWLQRKSKHVEIICGACLMIRREAYEQVNGFDEEFELYFEDSDLCYRTRQAGWEIDFVADARITHHLGQSTKGSWTATSLIYQQSHMAYYRKHAPIWAQGLLKLYLYMKWLRLRYVIFLDRDRRDLSVPYCRAYLKMLSEKTRITLEEGVPK